MDDRAVSSPVGVVLLIGMTIASVTAMFAVGGAVIDDTRADAERSQMENAMSEFSSKTSLVGLGEAGDQRFSLGRAVEGDVRVDPDAGEVALYVNRTNESKTELNRTEFGAVIYESGATEIAYQGGGVWARQDGSSRMVSPPEYHYRLETLTFPIMTVSGEGAVGGRVGGTVRTGGDGRDWYPVRGNESLSNPLEEGTVLVEIRSRYCAGWETFFTERSEGMIAESCGDDRTLTVDLTVPFSISGDRPVMAKSIDPSSGDVPDGWDDGVVAPSISPEVEDQIEACSDGSCGDPPETEISAGRYNVSGSYSLDDVTFDTSDGDVTVVADGDLTLNEVDIEGDGNVTLYVADELTVKSANSGGNATQLTSFVHSDGSVSFDGDSDYTGIIYAPKSDIKFSGAPSIDYKGALVAETIDISGNADKLEFEPDPDLEEYQLAGGDRPLTYLHVSENPIEIELD